MNSIRLGMATGLSGITFVMTYFTILSPYNRVWLRLPYIPIDDVHTYSVAFLFGTLVYFTIKGLPMKLVLLSIPMFLSMHETIWTTFDVIVYPVYAMILHNSISGTVIFGTYLAISILTFHFMVKKTTLNLFLIFVYIAFNIAWAIGFGYINTLMILPNHTNPFLFNPLANGFEFTDLALFTAIWVKVFKK